MGKISDSNAMNKKRLDIMDKILDKIDLELNMISNSSSVETDEDVCRNIMVLADTFNRLDLWLNNDSNSDNEE